MNGLWLLLLEAGVALGLLIFIVWWTLPRNPPRDGGEDDGRADR